MTDNPLNQVLSSLETTIGSINNKVEENKTRTRAYKEEIIKKLIALNIQLDDIKNNNNLKLIPQLREQLQQSQSQLDISRKELDETKNNLVKATNELQQ